MSGQCSGSCSASWNSRVCCSRRREQPSPKELPCTRGARCSTPPGAGGRRPADGHRQNRLRRSSQPEDPAPPDPQPVPGKAQDPFGGNADHGKNQGRTITWSLRVRQAPEPIRAAWVGTSRIVEVDAEGTREDKPFRATHLLLGHQAHLSVRHQLAHHTRRPAATGAGPLEPGGLALDPRHPAAGGRPSLPGQRCRCTGQSPNGSTEPAEVQTVSDDRCGDARQQGAGGDGSATAEHRASLAFSISPGVPWA